MCRDHLMTSIGDTAGYSTGWFSPKQTFTNATKVSWDVNITNLLGRTVVGSVDRAHLVQLWCCRPAPGVR